MKEKIQNFVNIAIIIVFIIGLIVLIISLIADIFKENPVITKQNVKEYTTEDRLITRYSTFSSLEKCVNNLYESFINQDYDEIYKLVGEITKDEYTREKIETEIKRYGENVFGTSDVMAGHAIELRKAYTYRNSYLVEITSTYSKEIIYMIINLDLYNYTYNIDLVF